MTFAWGLNNLVSCRTVCEDNKKAVILTTELKTTGLKKIF